MTVSSGLPPLADGVTLCELGVDNLRALRMEQPVELRRLTLLAGRNGIGKSTFARVFPLLRQSARVRKREPLLWWEHGEVDFGGFEAAVRRSTQEMTFTFGFADPDGTRWTATSVLVRDNEGWSRVHRVSIEQQGRWFSLRFGDDGPDTVEGRSPGDSFTATDEAAIAWLLPELAYDRDHLFAVPDLSTRATTRAYVKVLWRILEASLGTDDDRSIFVTHLTTADFWHSLFPWTNESELLGDLSTDNRRRVQDLLKDPALNSRLRRMNFCVWALGRVSQAAVLAREIGNRTAYLGPFRAAPERSYQPQGVAVDQLDPRGGNLAMFLVALTDEEREALNAELRAKLGFSVSIEAAGGRYSLHIELNDGRFNLVDVGSGYSHILPVAVQLWASRRTLSTNRDRVPHAAIVIEQPEVHLHPHQQAIVAQALGAFAVDEHGPVQIIETHSDHLIGEIGMMIALGKLPPELVGVLCFEPHSEGGTRVFNAHFNEDGVLHDWPVGFLSP